MFLSIATTHQPATDLGFLLMKHPDRVHHLELPFGKAVIVYPEARPERCEAALILEVDPVALVRGRGTGEGMLDQYVNDRPYAATSLLSVAINRAFRTAMAGGSKERPELANAPLPLEVTVRPLPAPGGETLLRALFEPLGWTVAVTRVEADGRPSRYVSLTLTGVTRLSEALSHLYVLIPVLDGDKHYWVGEDEVDKLIAKAGPWLAAHPEKDLIARRYLRHQRSLARVALARLAPEEDADTDDAGADRRADPEAGLEAPLRLHDQRFEAVFAALVAAGARTVVDLGCGEGKLLARLARDRRFERIYGLDASARSLERAAERLRLDAAGGAAVGRITLLHGALTYRDRRWEDADAAVLVEVIEHLEPDRLPTFEKVVFGAARPKTVIITTPNAEHNALFPGLVAGGFRHPDHRFEWTRSEFQAWTDRVAAEFGYRAEISAIGPSDPQHGAPTQMVVFAR